VSEYASARDAMGARFPYADFRAYFAFIDTCAGGGDYRHHVAPKCEFPELEKNWQNIALLSYEDHKEAHRLLSEAVPEHTGFRLAIIYMFAYESGEYVKAMKLNGQAAVESGALAKAREAQGGYEGMCASLVKARAALSPEMRTASLAKGRATQAADGYSAFINKGRETNAATGWANLVKGRAARDPKKTLIAQIKCGLEAADSGQLAKARDVLGLEGLRNNMAKGRHTRYHVRRGVVDSSCKFCNV
jgi:hypothetical protein